MKKDLSYRKPALAIAASLLILSLGSLFFLLPGRKASDYAADIFQDGILIETILLSEVQEERIFTIEGEGGCVNVIAVRPGSIAIISANCPDKLCVHQGFISDSRLPITCLPNRLVIQLRPVSVSSEVPQAPDAIAY